MWSSTNHNSNQLDHVIFNQWQFKPSGLCDLQPITSNQLDHVISNQSYSSVDVMWPCLDHIKTPHTQQLFYSGVYCRLWVCDQITPLKMWLKQINRQSDWVTTKVLNCPQRSPNVACIGLLCTSVDSTSWLTEGMGVHCSYSLVRLTGTPVYITPSSLLTSTDTLWVATLTSWVQKQCH